jgi:Putative S-adenosyl-L-methionine-dependent methyltransferase
MKKMNGDNWADKCFFKNWCVEDGILLLEVNRMLRAGGYFAWAAQPVYKHEEPQMEAWKGSLSISFAPIPPPPLPPLMYTCSQTCAH